MYSARKPYLKLKMSVGEFFKSGAVFMKQLHMKFSEFEKPYLEGEYNQMHLNIPTPDWGTWTPRALPPSSGFPGLPGYEPGKNTFGIPPDPEDWKCSQGGCIIIDWPPYYVEPGEFFKLWAWPGMYPVANVIIEGPVVYLNDCIGHPGSQIGLCSFFCGGWMQVQEDAEDGEAISITFITADGLSCRYTGEVKAACDPAAVITYTTLQMAINEEQSLGVSIAGDAYTWAISSGGGSLSTNEGSSTTYTAPASNANCASNPTITLSCDEVVIDSITIAINAVTADNVYKEISDCTDTDTLCDPTVGGCLEDWFCCWRGLYSCAGVENSCIRESLYNNYDDCHAAALCIPVGITDYRSEAQIAAGCCPEALI